MPFSFKCNPLTLHINVAVSSLRAYFFPLEGFSNVIVLLIASYRFFWPLATLSHVGLNESSKSAMKTLTSAFRAFIIIFLSTGPVISTLLSSKSAGISLTFQSLVLTSFVSSKKSGKSPALNFACFFKRSSSKSSILELNLLCKS